MFTYHKEVMKNLYKQVETSFWVGYVSPTLCCLYRLVQEIQNSAKSSTTGLYLCVSETTKFQLQIPKLEYVSSFTEV